MHASLRQALLGKDKVGPALLLVGFQESVLHGDGGCTKELQYYDAVIRTMVVMIFHCYD